MVKIDASMQPGAENQTQLQQLQHKVTRLENQIAKIDRYLNK